MSELEFIDNRIKELEFRIAHPNEYNLTPTIKVRIDDGACYKKELATLKNIREKLIDFIELKQHIKRWHDLLLKTGINSKGTVADEIENYWAIKMEK